MQFVIIVIRWSKICHRNLILADFVLCSCFCNLRASQWKPGRHQWSLEKSFASISCFFCTFCKIKERVWKGTVYTLICNFWFDISGRNDLSSKIFVESWIHLHSLQINRSKLSISTERRFVNKMSFLSGVSLNFVENSIVCAKLVQSTSSQVLLGNGCDSCQAAEPQDQNG